MTLIDTLKRRLADLEVQVQQVDRLEREQPPARLELPTRWFPQGLFHCESAYILDYYRELAELVNKLESQWQAGDEAPHLQAMADRIGQQFLMLYPFAKRRSTALQTRARGRRRPPAPPQPLPRDLHQLYQRLRQQQDYERRLEEMLYSRRQQLTLVDAQESARIASEIHQYSTRLSRCRQATREVETAIAQLENGS